MGWTLASRPSASADRRAWRGRVAAVVFGLFLLCAASAAGLGAAPNQDQQATVMLDVVDAPLTQVVRMLTQQSGVNIIISDTAELAGKKVTAHLDGLSLEKVLNYIVTSAGVSYRKTEDGTYLIGAPALDLDSSAPVTADKTPEEPVPAAPPAAGSAPPEPPARKIITEVIKLVHSAPGDIIRALGVAPGRMRSTYTAGSMDEQFPWKPSTPDRPIVYSPRGVSVEPREGSVEAVPPTYDQPRSMYGEAQRAPGDAVGEARQYQPVPTTRPGYPGAAVPGTAPGGAAAAAGGAAAAGTTGQQGLLPPGIEFMMAYDTDNSLIVRGTPEGLAELKDLISRYLDIPPKQVSIKAEFIEVSSSDVQRLGIDWEIDRLNTTFNTNFAQTGNVVIGFATGNVTAALKAELTTGKGRVVNSPIVSTLNNTPASISIGTYIPYFQGTTVTPTTGVATTTYSLIQLPVQTYLFVLPRVNGDGSITLYLEPSVQDTGRIYQGPSGAGEFPETRNQTLRTNRRIMNGETIVVGGFIRRSDSTSVSKVPLLGDLPLIGPLFRSTSVSNDDRELLIFLTPTIIPEKGGTTLGVIS